MPLFILVLVIFAFFAKLFFPPSMFITPDYGRSDLLHFNIPVKTMLSDSLKNYELPFWEPRIGQGFPVFDEGQIGTFYIPNLILFTVLPFWLAFNLGYIVTFLLASFGSYLLARSLTLSKVSSYLAAITYGFSPIFTLHIHHYNLIQAAALVPWYFWLVNSFFEKKSLAPLAAIPVLLSQHFFIGFPQITVYTLFVLMLYFIFKLQTQIKPALLKIKIAALLTLFIILGLFIASPQITATRRLADQTGRFDHVNIQSLLTDFPLKPKNLLTALDPFILGKPQNGSYPTWQKGSWSVFWESNLYFGIVQLTLIALVTVLFLKKFKTKNRQFLKFLIFLFILSILLSLGASSPLYPLFSIPPFSFFRVPARFLLFTFLLAALLAGITLDQLLNKKKGRLPRLLLFLLPIIATLDIFRVWYSYNPVGEKDRWLAKPEIATSILPRERVATSGQSSIWNKTFIEKGWENQGNDFFFFRNFIGQNSNIIAGLDHLYAYAGITPRRTGLIERFINGGITTNNNEIEISKTSQKILDFTGTKYLVTVQKIHSNGWQEAKTAAYGNTTIYLYKNLSALPRAYAAGDYKIATTVGQFRENLEDENYDPSKTIILEQDPNFQKTASSDTNTVSIIEDKNTKVTLTANLKSDSLVVLSDSFYPGWQAKVDGQVTKIMAANINSRATVVKKGSHLIEFSYSPDGLKFWSSISIASLILSLVIFTKYRNSTVTPII